MLDRKLDINFEIGTERNISPTSLVDLRTLAQEERKPLIEKLNESKLGIMQQRSMIISTLAQQTAKERYEAGHPTGFVFARKSNGLLVGYSIAALCTQEKYKPDTAELLFFGIKYSEMHLGVGTSLLQMTHSTLQHYGYKRYRMTAEEDLLRIVRKLNIPFIISPSSRFTRGKGVTVFLE